MTVLAKPLTLPCGVTLPNRIAKSAMTEGLCTASGHANERHERLYRAWSEGGAGLHVTGNVMVDWRYLERPGNVVVEDGGGLDALTRWAEAGTAGGNQLWVQISHPGRQCSRMSNAHPVAPSAVQLKLGGFFGRPRALTEPEILEIIERYARTAGIVQRAGFTYERLKFLEEQDALDEAASTRRHLRSCAFRSLATESCWSSASRGSGRGSRRKR